MLSQRLQMASAVLFVVSLCLAQAADQFQWTRNTVQRTSPFYTTFLLVIFYVHSDLTILDFLLLGVLCLPNLIIPDLFRLVFFSVYSDLTFLNILHLGDLLGSDLLVIYCVYSDLTFLDCHFLVMICVRSRLAF